MFAIRAEQMKENDSADKIVDTLYEKSNKKRVSL